jgi:outer membrane murein-binding lipoprotein Lpp
MCSCKFFGCVMLGVLAASCVGCGSSSTSSSNSGGASMDALSGQVDSQNAARQQQQADAAAKAAADQAAAQAAAQPPAQRDMKAVGSRPPMQGGGYLRAIGSARRHVMNVADSIAWIQGVRSFKAEEGRKPKNNDEFMKVVVPRYELQLPRIEADQEYLYDPNGETDGDFGQLYVVEKTPAGTPTQPPVPASGQPPAPAPAQK